jgi:hypothetical protein
MVVTVMGPAQRYRELVADLASHRPGLGEPQVVGVSGASPANQTGLGCNELQVCFVAMAAHLADGELAFVDFGGNSFSVKMYRSWRIVINDQLRDDGRPCRLLGCCFDLSRASPWSLDDVD